MLVTVLIYKELIPINEGQIKEHKKPVTQRNTHASKYCIFCNICLSSDLTINMYH